MSKPIYRVSGAGTPFMLGLISSYIGMGLTALGLTWNHWIFWIGLVTLLVGCATLAHLKSCKEESSG